MLPPETRQEIAWLQEPFRELFRLAWPIAVSSLSYTAMTLTDTLLIGHLGAAPLAGIGLGGIAAITLLCFSFGLLRGAKTLVAQAVGAGRREEIGPYLGAALVVGASVGLLTVLVGQVVALLLPLLAATPAVGLHAATYLQIRILGAPLVLTFTALREVRYAQSDMRSSMVASIVANVANILLAWVFIYKLRAGVAGAAWATILASTLECGGLAWVQHRKGWHLRGTSLRHIRNLVRVGIPTALQFALEIGSFATLSAMLAALGEVDMAAHQIAVQVIHVSFLPALAVGEAASVLAGQAVGANRDSLVPTVAHKAFLLGGAYTLLCTLALVSCADWIVAPFTSATDLRHTAMLLLQVAALFQVADAANIVARCTLRATGDVRFPATVGVVTSWAFTPPLAWLFGYRMGLGATGAWLGLTAEIVVAAMILWWRLERRTWHAAAAQSRADLGPQRGSANLSLAPQPP
jgi:MATE family multidrug resistance protein